MYILLCQKTCGLYFLLIVDAYDFNLYYMYTHSSRLFKMIHFWSMHLSVAYALMFLNYGIKAKPTIRKRSRTCTCSAAENSKDIFLVKLDWKCILRFCQNCWKTTVQKVFIWLFEILKPLLLNWYLKAHNQFWFFRIECFNFLKKHFLENMTVATFLTRVA